MTPRLTKRHEKPPRDPDRFIRVGLAPKTRALLRRFELAPRKQLGQNFLVDEFVLGQIIEAADLDRDDTVLEVGPGLGVLTTELAARCAAVYAIEVDPGMARALRETLAETPNVTIVEGDALEVEPGDVVGDRPYSVVANIPYHITSALLRHLFEARHPPASIVVMIQLEVAQRVIAQPGDMNLLAVSVQFYGVPRLVGRVGANAFYPAPTVDSALLRVDRRPTTAVDVPAEPFFKTVSAGFAMRRKQIHNALSERLWFPTNGAVDALTAVGIEPSRRAQTLSLDEWGALTRELMARGIV